MDGMIKQSSSIAPESRIIQADFTFVGLVLMFTSFSARSRAEAIVVGSSRTSMITTSKSPGAFQANWKTSTKSLRAGIHCASVSYRKHQKISLSIGSSSVSYSETSQARARLRWKSSMHRLTVPSMTDRDPLPTWVSEGGRTTLLGDSAHPFL